MHEGNGGRGAVASGEAGGSGEGGGKESSTLGETKMLTELRRLLPDEEGATALEYGLMAAAVAGVLIIAAYFLGGRVSRQLNNVAQHIG
jgi:Flp pilus assembly pilin Flp